MLYGFWKTLWKSWSWWWHDQGLVLPETLLVLMRLRVHRLGGEEEGQCVLGTAWCPVHGGGEQAQLAPSIARFSPSGLYYKQGQ